MDVLKMKILIVLSVIALSLGMTLVVGGQASAAPGGVNNKETACEGAGLVGGGDGCSTNGGPTIEGTIKTIVNILTIIVGLIAVVMVIVGGFKFITSAGSAENISSAKKTILYAVIGLIVVALAQIIVRFVLSKVG